MKVRTTLGEYLTARCSVALPLTVASSSGRIYSGGTYFLAEYCGHLLAITANHCLSNLRTDITKGQILLGGQSILPVTRFSVPTEKTDDYGVSLPNHERDVAIFDVDRAKFEQLQDRPASVQSLDDMKAPDFAVGSFLYAEGYPRKRFQPNRRTRQVISKSNKAVGVYEGQENLRFGRIKFSRFSDRDLNGFSGAPVFAWHRKTATEGLIGFVGMLIETRRFLLAHVICNEIERHLVT